MQNAKFGQGVDPKLGHATLRIIGKPNLVEESVFNDLPQHTVENLRRDLAGVRGGLAQLIVSLLFRSLKAKQYS